MKAHLKRWLPVYIWLVIIFTLSSIPNFHPPYSVFRKFDKIFHFGEYLILGFLLRRGFATRSRGVFLFSILTGISIAFLDEIHQYLIPGRVTEIGDFLMNCAGILIAQVSIKIVK
jgi:VanZ family protein